MNQKKKEQIFQMRALDATLPDPLDLHFHMCGTTYPNRNYSINRPHSDICCIEYIHAGTGHVTVGGVSFSPTAGDTYFLPQGVDQLYHSDRRDPWKKIWVNLSGGYLLRQAKAFGIEGIYHFKGLDTSDLLMKLRYYAEHSEQPDCGEQCLSILTQIFYRMSLSTVQKETPPQTPAQLMLAYIAQHKTEPIRLDQLAAVCKRSPSQAERLFRAETGMPPYRYLLSRKLELACRLLRETGMSVRDIASYLSFQDEFYFSGLFRRKIGVSPSEYRKQAGSQKITD
jgi:AraC-like DNA-binding protein